MARKKNNPHEKKNTIKESRRINENGLTEKQELFCQYYIDTEGNASEAYRMAYNTENMEDATIWRKAKEVKDNGKVTARILEIKEERAQASKIERQKVEKVLLDIIMADPRDLYKIDSITGKMRFKTPSQLPKRIRNALKKIKNNKGVVEYEFQGKVEAARLLGKWNGWEKTEINLNHNLNEFGEIVIGDDITD